MLCRTGGARARLSDLTCPLTAGTLSRSAVFTSGAPDGSQEAGCRYLDRYHYIADHGTRHDIADPCRFLIKPIPDRPSR